MKNNRLYLKIEAACMTDLGYAIGMTMDSNGLFKLNLENGLAEFIEMIPTEGINISRLYTTAYYKNGMVYFTPHMANDIAIYDLERNNIIKKQVEPVQGRNIKKKFSGIIEYGNYLFMTPCTYPAVLRINTITGKMDYFGNWTNGEKFLFRKRPEVVGSHFYIPSVVNDMLLDFDMEKCEGRIHHIGIGSGYWSACHVDNSLWLAPINQDPVVSWNIDSHEISKIQDYPDGFEGRGFLFTNIYTNQDGIFLIPAKANMSVQINPNKMNIRRANVDELTDNNVTEFLADMDGFLYLKTVKNGHTTYLRMNKTDNSIESFGFYLMEDDAQKYRKDLIGNISKHGEAMKENATIGLNDFIGALIR